MADLKSRIGKLPKQLDETIEWSSSIFSYLRATIQELKKLSLNSADKGLYNSARSQLRYALRSQRRMLRHYNEMKETFTALQKEERLPMRKNLTLIEIQTALKPHEAELFGELSFFTGEMNDKLRDVGIQVDLYKKGKTTQALVRESIGDFISELENLMSKKVSGGNVGLVPFMAILKEKLKPWINDLVMLAAA
ncbi:hypothetical protein J4421_04025 [Candidatus Woesearchaeota archaeon]|nr:hypothetical protein [Candidatus Woesearchaeota archaeon]